MHFIPAVALLAATIQPAPLDSAQPAPAPFRVFPQGFKIEPLPVKDRWAVEVNEERCGLAAWTKTPDGGGLGIWAVHPMASDDYMLGIMVPIRQPANAEVTMPQVRITGSKLEHSIEKAVYVSRASVEGLEVLTLKLDRQLMEGILASRELTIEREGERTLRIKLEKVGAISSLLECERTGLKAVGLDPALPERLSKWPTFDPPTVTLFSDSDYPASAMAAGAQGKAQVQLDVDPAGIAGACRVLKSSGSPVLDTQTCNILLRRGKLTPALDKSGKPVAAPVVTTVNWRLEP